MIHFFISFLLAFSLACSTAGPSGNTQTPAHKYQTPSGPKPLSLVQVKNLGWTLPKGQHLGDLTPPQPGTKVQGQNVTLWGKDTPWTAFTLVIFIKAPGQYEILTQKRGIHPTGVIETTGGHLEAGMTWRQGVAAELAQEAGIVPGVGDHLIYLSQNGPALSLKGNMYGNMNFVLVYQGQKPKTTEQCPEIDQAYGHPWVDLRVLYDQVKAEKKQLGRNHGVYYGFFRDHVIGFCDRVLGWS